MWIEAQMPDIPRGNGFHSVGVNKIDKKPPRSVNAVSHSGSSCATGKLHTHFFAQRAEPGSQTVNLGGAEAPYAVP